MYYPYATHKIAAPNPFTIAANKIQTYTNVRLKLKEFSVFNAASINEDI